MRRVFQTNVSKFIFFFHLHNISYILYISYINFVYITCIIYISYIFTISFTPLTSPTSSTWTSSTSHASSTSTSAYLLQNSHGVMYKGLVTQEFLHRNCYKGILAHELLHWSWYTGVNFQVIYLYLNSYKTPTSQVLLNSLFWQQGQPNACLRNATFCGDGAYRAHKRVVKCWILSGVEWSPPFAPNEGRMPKLV